MVYLQWALRERVAAWSFSNEDESSLKLRRVSRTVKCRRRHRCPWRRQNLESTLEYRPMRNALSDHCHYWFWKRRKLERLRETQGVREPWKSGTISVYPTHKLPGPHLRWKLRPARGRGISSCEQKAKCQSWSLSKFGHPEATVEHRSSQKESRTCCRMHRLREWSRLKTRPLAGGCIDALREWLRVISNSCEPIGETRNQSSASFWSCLAGALCSRKPKCSWSSWLERRRLLWLRMWPPQFSLPSMVSRPYKILDEIIKASVSYSEESNWELSKIRTFHATSLRSECLNSLTSLLCSLSKTCISNEDQFTDWAASMAISWPFRLLVEH